MVEAAEGNPTTWKFTQYVLERSLKDILGGVFRGRIALRMLLGTVLTLTGALVTRAMLKT